MAMRWQWLRREGLDSDTNGHRLAPRRSAVPGAPHLPVARDKVSAIVGSRSRPTSCVTFSRPVSGRTARRLALIEAALGHANIRDGAAESCRLGGISGTREVPEWRTGEDLREKILSGGAARP
jgi:hypothetical protein